MPVSKLRYTTNYAEADPAYGAGAATAVSTALDDTHVSTWCRR